MTDRSVPSDPENGVLGPIVYCGSVMVTDSPKPWYHCTWLCVHIMGRLNDSLLEFLNADSIHNGPIFDPLDGATAVTAVWARNGN